MGVLEIALNAIEKINDTKMYITSKTKSGVVVDDLDNYFN